MRLLDRDLEPELWELLLRRLDLLLLGRLDLLLLRPLALLVLRLLALLLLRPEDPCLEKLRPC